jgi:hypothetical protein
LFDPAFQSNLTMLENNGPALWDGDLEILYAARWDEI